MPADEHRPPSPTGSTPDDARFDVFLSHNSADKPAVEAIALRLRDEAKLNPFLDKWNLIPGEHFIPALERALERSNTVAIFFGSHGEGNWHREEKLLALVHGAEQRERRIIPVLLSAARSRPVKGFLRSRTWVDLANADGFERLLAGILGKEPGSLSVPPLPPHQPSPPSASAKKVYVCSTYLDDPTRCRTVERAIVDAGMAPVGLSHFTAAGRPTHEQRKTLIRDCDCLLGIVAHRYGPIPEGDSRSMMEIEYDEAVEYLKPRLMLTHASTTVDFETDFDEGPERWDKQAKLQAFREKIARDRAPGRFVDETLGTMVLEGLTELRARWVDDPPAGTGVTEAELRRYLDKIEASHREVQLAGFENAVRVKLELDELFVPLDAVIDHHGRGRDAFGAEDLTEKDGMDGRHGMREQIPLAEAFGCARELGHSGVVLLGDPGSGKTTHLKQVLLEIVRNGPEAVGLPEGTVPVFLPLRNLRDLDAGLPGFIEQELRDPLLSLPASFGPRLVARGKLLFLLDGLDEVSDAAERARVARWIEAARLADADNSFLVSCRFAGYTSDVQLDAGFIELHVRPMSDEQVRSFVTRWYEVVEKATSRDPQHAKLAAAKGIAGLLKILDDAELAASARVYEMTHNPLLLTAICLVHRDLGELPRARAALYEEAVKVLLERWRTVMKRLPVVLPRVQSLQVLQPVARWMHEQRGRTRASAEELREPVERGLATLRDVSLEPDAFLRAIRDESGLLTGWGVDRYGFMHLGFQEYLTAHAIKERAFDTVEVGEPGELAQLATRFGDSWWQEVILLLLAQGDRVLFERFMGEVVRQPGFREWARSPMMSMCLGEAREVSSRPFVALVREGPRASGWLGRVGRWLSGKSEAEDELAARQLVAARLLARTMPEALAGLGDVLAEHRAPALRAWWAQWQVGEREVWVAPRGGVELVEIPGGTFLMGSADGDEMTWDDEKPQHAVTLESFLLARTPVTNAQYRKFLEDPERPQGVQGPEHWGDRNYNQDEQPVVGVSWNDAQAYCAWAGLVLPTEAQWEYACRAGTTTRFSSGDTEEDLAKVGWYKGNSGGQLHAVGELEPNEFGLFDMHGNVREWCEDDWVGSYEKAEHRLGDGLRVKPVGAASRVIRGGFFGNTVRLARSAFRNRFAPGGRWNSVGFRPAQGHPFQS